MRLQPAIDSVARAKSSAPAKDIDPLALPVLKPATDPVRDSQSYPFRALVSREHLAQRASDYS